MSGPKSSRYTLTAEQLRRIREEQERLRKELEEKARIERENQEAQAILSNIKFSTARLISMTQDYERKTLSCKTALSAELRNQYEQLYTKAQRLDAVCRTTQGSGREALMKARGLSEELFDALRQECGALIAGTNDWILQQRIQSDTEISERMQLSFASVGYKAESADPEKARIEAELDELLLLDVSETLKKEIERARGQLETIENAEAWSNFSAITVASLKKRCTSEVAFRKANDERFRNAHVRYSALCEQLEEREKDFEFTQSGLAALEDAVSDCEQRVLRSAEQAYISRSVDEVMREMGYEVIGQRKVQKKSGRSFKSTLLTYEDGTVVNVTESSTGQITMEVGGADDIDRLPDVNERIALRKTMEAFCKDFKEIEQRLSERGVVLDSRLSMAPPEEAYAQIINYTDYELVDDYQKVRTRKKRVSQSQEKRQIRND